MSDPEIVSSQLRLCLNHARAALIWAGFFVSVTALLGTITVAWAANEYRPGVGFSYAVRATQVGETTYTVRAQNAWRGFGYSALTYHAGYHRDWQLVKTSHQRFLGGTIEIERHAEYRGSARTSPDTTQLSVTVHYRLIVLLLAGIGVLLMFTPTIRRAPTRWRQKLQERKQVRRGFDVAHLRRERKRGHSHIL